MIIVTTPEIPGYRVEAVLGAVSGMGGDKIWADRDQVFATAMERITADAAHRGANAIVGTQLLTIAENAMRAFGTAVVVEPIPAGQPGATPQSAYLAGQGQPQAAPPQGYPQPVQDDPRAQGF